MADGHRDGLGGHRRREGQRARGRDVVDGPGAAVPAVAVSAAVAKLTVELSSVAPVFVTVKVKVVVPAPVPSAAAMSLIEKVGAASSFWIVPTPCCR